MSESKQDQASAKVPQVARNLSLPKQVVAAGGIDSWNAANPELAALHGMVTAMCTATTVEEAVVQVRSMIDLGHYLYPYLYMRNLASRNMDLAYAAILAEPAMLLPVMYTPTVGEACQKFGKLPLYSRGCYVSISDRGNLRAVLEE